MYLFLYFYHKPKNKDFLYESLLYASQRKNRAQPLRLARAVFLLLITGNTFTLL
jgi:hypothetical protein